TTYYFTLSLHDALPISLVNDSLVLVSAPTYQINKTNLDKESWIVREKGSGTREVTDKFLKRLDHLPRKLLEFSSTQLIKSSVERSEEHTSELQSRFDLV